MASPLEQRGVKRRRDRALSNHDDSSGLFPHRDTESGEVLGDKTHCDKTPEQGECPAECPFSRHVLDEAAVQPEFPEPEDDDGSLDAVAQRLYTRINGLWQTRILRLMPGPLGSALSGDLLVADIVLLPGLVLHDESRLISFQAVSYCCGEPVLTRRIRLNADLFPITENPYLALQTLRRESEPIFVGVDAICIHQDMPDEKSQQVVNMLNIYRKASQVDIWLGARGRATGLAMDFLCSATESLVLHVQKHPQDLKLLLDGICDLLSRPWFQRIWVKQELYAASKVVVHCGSDVAPGDVFGRWTTALEIMLQMQNLPRMMEVHCETLYSFRRATPRELVERDLPEEPNGRQARDSHLDIINVFKRCAGSKCTQSQDHVYALLGMTNVKHRAKPAVHVNDGALIIDYTKGAAELFIDVARHVIRRDKNLAILHLNAASEPTDKMIDLPSWVPDFRLKQSPLLRYFGVEYPRKHAEVISRRRGKRLVSHELLTLPVAVSCNDETYRFELQSDDLPSSRLALTGYRIGSLVPDNAPWNPESYRMSAPDDAWNVFHERHIYRHGVPEELLRELQCTVEAEVSATDLVTISLAVYESIHPFQSISMPGQEMKYFLVNIIWKRKLLGSVVVSWHSTESLSPLWGVVSPDQYRCVQCLYTEDCCKRLKYWGDLRLKDYGDLGWKYYGDQPSSWIVPSNAKKDDLLIAALGSPLPIIVRLHSSTLSWEYVGSAVPCQIRTTEPLSSDTMSRIRATKYDKENGLLLQFILE